jgi:hypothetical protein
VRADGGVEEAAATLTEKLAALTAAGTRVLIIHGAQDRLVRDPPPAVLLKRTQRVPRSLRGGLERP